ncbi:MAG: type III-B CRISPR module-associated protein Cmr5 [Deltaproteobacteria bacterium]|nr:type III-B CRISPR module-associated protein Cmr5 [Deltaproteobacteria bacterium]
MERKYLHRTLDQLRADYAWGCVENAARDKIAFGDYVSLVRQFPADIQTAGLGQSTAFLFSKENKSPAHSLLKSHIGNWLLGRELPGDDDFLYYDAPLTCPNPSTPDLMQAIRGCSGRAYLRASVEALKILAYLKRFAKGKQALDERYPVTGVASEAADPGAGEVVS